MSLRKTERIKARKRLLYDLALKRLNGFYEETGPIYSIGGQFTLNLNNFQDMLKQAEPATRWDKD
jgi:hypothetical protein